MPGTVIWSRTHGEGVHRAQGWTHYYYPANVHIIQLSSEFTSLHPYISAALRPHQISFSVQWAVVNVDAHKWSKRGEHMSLEGSVTGGISITRTHHKLTRTYVSPGQDETTALRNSQCLCSFCVCTNHAGQQCTMKDEGAREYQTPNWGAIDSRWLLGEGKISPL